MIIKIVYIGAKWCSTCRVIKPKTEELAKKFQVDLVCVDLDEDTTVLTTEDKDSIRKVPTLRVYKDNILNAEFNTKQAESLEIWLQNNVSFTTADF